MIKVGWSSGMCAPRRGDAGPPRSRAMKRGVCADRMKVAELMMTMDHSRGAEQEEDVGERAQELRGAPDHRKKSAIAGTSRGPTRPIVGRASAASHGMIARSSRSSLGRRTAMCRPTTRFECRIPRFLGGSPSQEDNTTWRATDLLREISLPRPHRPPPSGRGRSIQHPAEQAKQSATAGTIVDRLAWRTVQ
jgi:hypothetical protein